MKKASIIAAALIATLVAGSAPAALAHSPEVDADAHIDTHVSGGWSGHHGGSDDADIDDDSNVSVGSHNATSTAHMNEHASTTAKQHRDHEDDTATSTEDRGHHGMGELHRSVVAAFVHSLLADADRDGGIGAQVRAVAQSQNDHASTTADAIAKVETRSKLISFLFGTDWNSLAAVKAAINTTQKDIDTLQTALDNATDAQVRADLSAQIQVLKDEQARMQAFVDAHEDGFSILGWLTKLFAKGDQSDDNS